MTPNLPEDVREQFRNIIEDTFQETLYNRSKEQWTQAMTDFMQRVDDSGILIAAKAEGYQEGVKAMREAVKERWFAMDIASLSGPAQFSQWLRSDDRLLNPEKEGKK